MRIVSRGQKMRNRKLKNFLINPKFQLEYLFWISLWGLILVGINSYVFYHYISENYEVFIELNDITPEAKALLYAELDQILVKLFGFSVLFLIMVTLSGIILSHRVAGPLYHFKKVFSAIKNGQREQRVRLRPNDKFQDVAEEFNQMMDSLQK